MNHVIIKTKLVCKSYLTGGEVNNVIKNMDIEIYKEDFTVIMGSSGSGKSTLLYLLSGMDQVTSGEVSLGDRDITYAKEKELAALRKDKIGFVFQGINLIPDLSIRENIKSPTYKAKSVGMEKDTAEHRRLLENRIDSLLEQMELTKHQAKFPGQLSGGQKQRAAICRALINQPDILFADEPTGALNSQAGEDVLNIFTEIHGNSQAVVMVTHDLKAAVRGNRIIYLRDGRVDGELRLDEYDAKTEADREAVLYEFLKKRGW